MYLRTTARRTKGGEVVRYLALAHNERNERGVPVARVVHNFGRENLVDREGLVRLVRSIQRFLGGEEALRAGAPHGFDFLAAPECGGPHLVGELWGQLGIGKAINRVAGVGRGRSGVERAIFTPCVWRSRRRPGPGSARHGATGTSTDGGGRARTSTPHGLGVGPVTIVHSRWTATTRWRSSTPLGTWTASTRGSRPSDVRRGRRTIRRPDIVWHVRDWEARMADVPSEIRGPSVA